MGLRRARGELEAAVLAVLDAAPDGLTAAEVTAALGRPLAPTTVLTALTRLHAKAAVRREGGPRGYRYRTTTDPQGRPAQQAAHRMRQLLEAGPHRDDVLARFVGELSAEDERTLRRLLAGDPDGAGA